MTDASTLATMSPELQKVAMRARCEPDAQFHSLAHLIDGPALRRAFGGLRPDAAVGVDGVTTEAYGQDLEAHLADLHARLREKRYRHQPILRKYIRKENGKMRPLGVSTTEDKIVQAALYEVLSAVYEQDFLPCSYGFRPRRSAHDAIRAFTETAGRDEANWVLEADITGFFDHVDRSILLDLLARRVPDGSIRRLVGKCLHMGVLEGEELTTPDSGTPQGSILSPMLANIYLHYALDLWFERDVKPRMRGSATLIRYADDFVICFEREDDARKVIEVLPKRLARFGLTLQPDKTRLVPFQRPPRSQGGKGPGSFDFLGFTHYWRRTRRGTWAVGCKTRRARFARAVQALRDYCRRHRHDPVADQHVGLCRRIRGHFQYFGVNGNVRRLTCLLYRARRTWHKWLNRRSQRARLSWDRFNELLKAFPLPTPRVYVQIWGR
jgi:group II intron reverse transcriptase/maturase